MYIKFNAPFNFEGEEHDGVELNLDGLTGNDIEKAQTMILMERKTGSNIPEFSKAYCAQVAALSAKKPVEFFRSLPVREYTKVTLEVQNFLLDGASEVGSTQ
ncbi:MAG: phage tail assembly protein [Synergistaceae bacterium]|jgi:hypothetical protein|nr:phage tail assembly protein [Synergistaceae bacterium]